MWALTVIKRGTSSKSPLPTIKVEGTPLPIIKMEVPSHPTPSESHGQAESDPSYGQSTPECDGADSDTVSEVDEKYSHEKVCDNSDVP